MTVKPFSLPGYEPGLRRDVTGGNITKLNFELKTNLAKINKSGLVNILYQLYSLSTQKRRGFD